MYVCVALSVDHTVNIRAKSAQNGHLQASATVMTRPRRRTGGSGAAALPYIGGFTGPQAAPPLGQIGW